MQRRFCHLLPCAGWEKSHLSRDLTSPKRVSRSKGSNGTSAKSHVVSDPTLRPMPGPHWVGVVECAASEGQSNCCCRLGLVGRGREQNLVCRCVMCCSILQFLFSPTRSRAGDVPKC